MALRRSCASAICFIMARIVSPFASISFAALSPRKVIVFHVFTQTPQSDLFSSWSSLRFLRSSVISASIWWIACAFIASLNFSCASAAIEMEREARSIDTPRSPYRPLSCPASFSASCISALERFSFSASCWSRSMRSWSVARSWSPLSRIFDISSDRFAVCFVADAM